MSIASHTGAGRGAGSFGIGLTLKKNSLGDLVVSRVKKGGPAAQQVCPCLLFPLWRVTWCACVPSHTHGIARMDSGLDRAG
jgi:hypothetical protein